MKINSFYAIKFQQDSLSFIDQTKLPFEENYIKTDSFEIIADAIEKLKIRGAPLIGIAAAYAVALAFKGNLKKSDEYFQQVIERLQSTRPTAVNLFHTLNIMRDKFNSLSEDDDTYKELLSKAIEIEKAEISYSEKIAKLGLNIFQKKSNVLTHCNTGSLAAAEYGTALGIIKKAFEHNLINIVYVDETRPLFQGLRLTSFELEKYQIPFEVLTDSMASSLISNNKVDLVIVGADRIALNGDTANKIGTLSLAIICNYFNIPLYVAAPSSTIDKKIISGSEIIIEHRSAKEIYSFQDKLIGKESWNYYNPAFDVTPSHLITGIITEKNIYRFPYNFINE